MKHVGSFPVLIFNFFHFSPLHQDASCHRQGYNLKNSISNKKNQQEKATQHPIIPNGHQSTITKSLVVALFVFAVLARNHYEVETLQ